MLDWRLCTPRYTHPHVRTFPRPDPPASGGYPRAPRPVTFDEYQRAAARTMNTRLSDTERLVDAAAGLAEEAGEVLGLVRKHAYMGHPLDRERVTRELGDALWCIAAVATCLRVTLDEVAEANVGKLRQRYPEGYSDDASRARRD